MDKLDEALNVLTEILKSTKDFVADQTPMVAKEIVEYSFFMNISWAIFWVIFILLSILSGFILYKAIKKDTDSDSICLLLIPIFIGSFSFYKFSSNMEEMIKAKVAPRVLILDYLRENIKK